MNLLSLFEHADDLQTFAAGEVLFSEGEVGDRMYVLTAGEVEIKVAGQVVGKAVPGEIVGEMALIDAGSRSATATALSDCKAAAVDERRFLFMVQQTPFFSLHVMRVLAMRLRHMDEVSVS